MRRNPEKAGDRKERLMLDAAQTLVRMVIVSCVILVLAYFALAAVVVIFTGDVSAIAAIGRAAAELIRALTQVD